MKPVLFDAVPMDGLPRSESPALLRQLPARLAMLLLCSAATLAPFPFGLTAPLPLAAFCLALATALALASTVRLQGRLILFLLPVLLAFAAYLAVAFVQMSPEIARRWGVAAPVWGELAAGGLTGEPLISWTAEGPWFALGAGLALVLALLSAAALGTDRRRAFRLLWAIAISGSCYALYGIVSHLVEPGLLLWREKTAYLDAVTGTFVNRNTAATYWGSCAIVWLALLMAETEPQKRPPRRRVLIACGMGFALCVVAVAMTGSRAGGLLGLLCIALTGGFWLLRERRRRWPRWVAPLLAAFIILVVVQFLGGLIGGRVRQYGLFDERRLDTYVDTLRIIGDYPWFGVGLGNFAVVFPRYRSDTLGSAGVWDRAHSTPLELVAEIGLPVTTILGLCCCVMLYALLRGATQRKRDRVIPLAGAGVGLLGVLHSSVDFSLQIAGYGIVFGAIVGCGLGQSVSTRQSRSDPTGLVSGTK